MNIKEIHHLLTRFSILLLIYSFLITLFPTNPYYIPSSVLIFGMISTLYKQQPNFKAWLINKFINMELPSQRQDIINAVASLRRYESLALTWNAQKKRNFKRITFAQQAQAVQLGYIDHLNETDLCIKNNAALCHAIADDISLRYKITDLENRAALYSQNNSKVIEAITHYARDWSEELGEIELKPLMTYIKGQIEKNTTLEERERTVILVPGSGLGRVAFELASISPQFKSVQSIEFSTLMHLCNEFIYSENSSSSTSFQLHPYIHTYSHHTSNANQHRHIDLSSLHKQQPSSLKRHLSDFRKFLIPNSTETYDTVIIVTCFFMDTAQNMFEYFQAIEAQIGPNQRGIWINIGPLKYGTAPLVEFSLEEIRKLRELRGWRDLDVDGNNGNQGSEKTELVGYLTDEVGLWRGYYGLTRWCSVFEPNNT